jgi:hypothetical protein
MQIDRLADHCRPIARRRRSIVDRSVSFVDPAVGRGRFGAPGAPIPSGAKGAGAAPALAAITLDGCPLTNQPALRRTP